MSKKLLAACLFSTISCFSAINYEVYLESWDSCGDVSFWQNAMEGLPSINGNPSYQGVTLNISFAAFLFDDSPHLQGFQFSNTNTQSEVDASINQIVSYVHGQGGKVKVSFGGASYAYPFAPNYFISQTTAEGGWPNNIQYLADGVIAGVQYYELDGVDFDIEDPQPASSSKEEFAAQLITFLQAVRTGLPTSIISITIPGQGWNSYWQNLAQSVGTSTGLVDYISFMEYDIGVSGTYPDQIVSDIKTYTSTQDEYLPTNYSPGWNIPISLVQLGLMGGSDDLGNILTTSAAESLTSVAADEGLYGVMFWDLDRDAGTTPNDCQPEVPPTDADPYAFSNAIRQAILDPTPIENFSSYLPAVRKTNTMQKALIKYPPPPHGAPPTQPSS